MAKTRIAFVLLLALASMGCQYMAKQLEEEIFNDHLALTMDRTSDLLPPEGLGVLSTEDREIDLHWDPVLVGGVAGYAILRAPQEDGDYALVGRTNSRFGTIFLDKGESDAQLGDGQTYHYRIHPYDRAGRVSRSHAYVSAMTEERPDVPQHLRSYSNLPRRTVLVWDANQRRSTTGYQIQRSPILAGPWERIGFAEGRLNTIFEDVISGDLRVMYYRVIASNRFGGESDPAEPVRAVTKADPLPPIGLQVSNRSLGRVDIAWTPNTETDLRGYQVWRSVNQAGEWTEETRIDEVPAEVLLFQDAAVGCGQGVRYRLRATDIDGLVSEFSEPIETVGEQLDLSFSAGTEPGTGILRWSPKSGDWTGARVIDLRDGPFPNRALSEVSGASQAELSGLRRGDRTLGVVLTRGSSDRPNPDGAPEPRAAEAPICEIQVQIP